MIWVKITLNLFFFCCGNVYYKCIRFEKQTFGFLKLFQYNCSAFSKSLASSKKRSIFVKLQNSFVLEFKCVRTSTNFLTLISKIFTLNICLSIRVFYLFNWTLMETLIVSHIFNVTSIISYYLYKSWHIFLDLIVSYLFFL
jgi:hypothetical protein